MTIDDRQEYNFTSPIRVHEDSQEALAKIHSGRNVDHVDSVSYKDSDYYKSEIARFSQTSATKFLIDNPKTEHQINLKNYQKYLDDKLSRPKQSPTRQSPQGSSPRSPRVET